MFVLKLSASSIKKLFCSQNADVKVRIKALDYTTNDIMI